MGNRNKLDQRLGFRKELLALCWMVKQEITYIFQNGAGMTTVIANSQCFILKCWPVQ